MVVFLHTLASERERERERERKRKREREKGLEARGALGERESVLKVDLLG